MVGNFTRDLELRYAPSGIAIGNAGLATNRKFKGSDGQQKEEICFVDITFFGRTAEIANQYLKKGSKVLIEGRLKFDTWEDQNGNKKSKHSITVETMQMLGSKSDTDGGGGYNNNSSSNQAQNNNPAVEQNNNYQTPNDNAYYTNNANNQQNQNQQNQQNYQQNQDQNKGYR